MLTVWGRKSSSNVQAVMWCIGELKLAYDRHDAGFTYGGLDTPEFLAMNPNGLIPVVKDGDGEPLWESGAIVRYLATRYGEGSFWPKDPAERAQVDKWAEWAKLNIAGAFAAQVFVKLVRTPPKDRNPTAIAADLAQICKKLAIADRELAKHAYLAGDAFTLADIQFGHILFRYFDLEIARPDLPALQRYYEALTARPAFSEHVMVSYDELKMA